jgi:hypothetical protein
MIKLEMGASSAWRPVPGETYRRRSPLTSFGYR